MTCRTCKREGFRHVTGVAAAPNRHAGVLPDAGEMKIKQVLAGRSGIILGGQMSGGPSVGELINMVALAIQKKVTARAGHDANCDTPAADIGASGSSDHQCRPRSSVQIARHNQTACISGKSGLITLDYSGCRCSFCGRPHRRD